MSSEYEQNENKQSLGEIKAVVESVAALASAKGGTIRIGVHPDGRQVGVQLGRNTLENLANEIKLNTRPPQYPSIEVEGTNGAAVIVVTVQESPLKPVWAYSRPFKRVGRTNQRLSPEETQRLMELTTGRTWDGLPGFRARGDRRSCAAQFPAPG
jgi:ATP-dependent DNA helicase RecG